MNNTASSAGESTKFVKVIWIAAIASIVIYFLIAYVYNLNSSDVTARGQVANLIWLFGLGFAGVGLMLPNMLLRAAPAQTKLVFGNLIRYVMFEILAICALFNLIKMNVSFAEAAAGIIAALVLVMVCKPSLPA